MAIGVFNCRISDTKNVNNYKSTSRKGGCISCIMISPCHRLVDASLKRSNAAAYYHAMRSKVAMLNPSSLNSLPSNVYIGKLTIIGSDNGLALSRRQAIIWTNARILLIRPLGTDVSESELKYFYSRKCSWKCCLRTGVHSVSASICQY